jgi:flagellar motor switch protein FliM
MEQILSQEEIDALLSGISEGDIETEREPKPGQQVEAALFDYVKYSRGKKDRLPALDFIYDRFSKSFRSALSLYIEKEVDVEVTPILYVTYEDFIKTVALPTNLNIVVTENLKGFFIVIFDAKLIFTVLETVFGSSNVTAPKVEGREFTKIEFSVIKKLINIVSAEMEKAWTPVYEIACKYSRSEINPNYVTMVSKEEIVSLCQFSVEIGDITSWIKVCIPYGILESIKGYLISTPSREDMEMREKWNTRLRQRVQDVPLEVRATLGRKKMSLQDCMQLAEQSVILVDRCVTDHVEVEVHDRTKFKAKVGVYKGNKAVMIEEVVN